MAERRWPWFAVLFATFLLWSNSFIAARILVGEEAPEALRVGPLGFVVVRFAPVALVCWAWLLLLPAARREAAWLLRHHGPLVVVLAALNVWGYNLPFAAGQHLVPPGTASLIITLNPLFTLLLALLIGQERFLPVRALGMLVAFFGVYQVVVHGAGRAVTGAYVGDALVLATAPLSWALYTVLGKRLLGAASPLTLTYLALGLGSLPALGLAAVDSGLQARVGSWGAERWGAALFLGLGCSVVGYALWFLALRHLQASTVAAFVFLNPPLTLVFEWLWFGRVPSWGLLAGGVLVLAGVGLCLAPGYQRGARRSSSTSAAAGSGRAKRYPWASS
ncbi:MAG TPA: DMT family transporter [Thermoanaerobaculia bacterium]|nr:DMT family transporter [Thermoanaerobaculia bacterium]